MPSPALARLWKELARDLERRAAEGLRRDPAVVRRLPGGELQTAASSAALEAGSAPLWDFSSNDYLGLSHHPAVREAAARAARDGPAGAGASRLISGNSPLYAALEARLAALKRAETALVFSSGYACNLGLLSALAERGDIILCDRLDHASLVDGARLSGAALRVFPHRDLNRLAHLLRKYEARRTFVVVDGVFSMDGDLAPLPELLELCESRGAALIVDDAHGLGVLGESGAGCLEHWGVDPARLIVMGTLSKAVGALGGYVVGPRTLRDALLHRARSLIYSTALPPAVLAAAEAALELIPGMGRERARLRDLKAVLAGPEADPTPIVPWLLGASEAALAAAEALRRSGYFVVAIRPPTVPARTARLRISLSALHPREVALALAERLRNLRAEL